MSEIIKFEKVVRLTDEERKRYSSSTLLQQSIEAQIIGESYQECAIAAHKEGLAKSVVGEKWTKFINRKPKEGGPYVEFTYELFCEKEVEPNLFALLPWPCTDRNEWEWVLQGVEHAIEELDGDNSLSARDRQQALFLIRDDVRSATRRGEQPYWSPEAREFLLRLREEYRAGVEEGQRA